MHWKTPWLTILCWNLFILIAPAQNVDSLKQEINICTTDSCKAALTYSLCRIYMRNNIDSAAHYESLNRTYAEKSALPKLIINNLFHQVSIHSQQKNHAACDSLYSLMYGLIKKHQIEEDYLYYYYGSRGVYFQRRDLLDSASLLYQKALDDIKPDFKNYYELQHKVLGNLGILERKQGNYKKALAYYEKAQLNLEKDSLSNKERFSIYEPIGFLYKHLGDYESSLFFYNKAKDNIGSLAGNKASVYQQLGKLYAMQKDTLHTLAYIDSLRPLYDNVTYSNQCKLAYALLQMNAFLDNKKETAHYMSAIKECHTNSKTITMNYWAAKAKYYYINEKYSDAFIYYDSIYQKGLINEPKRLKWRENILGNLITAGIKSGVDRVQLDQYYGAYRLLQNSIQAVVVEEEVEKFNVQFKTRIKQDSIRVLNLQTQQQQTAIRNRNIGIGISVLLLALLGIIARLFQQNAKKQRTINSLLEKEKEKLIFEKEELESLNNTLNDKVTLLQQESKKKVLPNKLKLKGANKIYLVDIPDIRYIKAENDGCRLYMLEEAIWVENSMKNLLGQLPKDSFLRIYRSTVVHIAFVGSIHHSSLQMQDGTALPIGRAYRKEIIELLGP